MKITTNGLRTMLCATTAVSFIAAAAAHAQSAGGINLNLGSVVATGATGGVVAPSATGSLAQAHALQKLSANVIAVQPAAQIQKLPDVNIAEALQRVPGISLETDTGQGRFINIRGLDADLNAGSYDGVHLTAANQSTPLGGARAVAFDAFPTGAVGGLEVVKSLTPDMDAEGLGGSINILPLTLPANGAPVAEISAAGGEETLRNTAILQDSITLGNSFAIPGMRSFANDKPFGIIANYTYHSDRRGIDDIEEGYASSASDGPAFEPINNLQLRHYDGHRVTQGFDAGLTFDPSPTTELFLRGLTGGYDEQLNKNRLELDGLDGSNSGGTLTDLGGGNYTATGATAKKAFTNSNERIGYNLIEAGGRTVLADALNVDFRGSWVEGYDDTVRNYSTTYKDSTPFTVNYSDTHVDYRTFNTPGVDLSNPADFKLSSIKNSPGRSQDQEFAAGANASFAHNLFGALGQAKFGFLARLREEGTYSDSYAANLSSKPLLSATDQGNQNVTYYNNEYAIGPNVSYNNLLPLVTGYTADPTAPLTSFAHNVEDVYAIYGQDTLQAGPLQILYGLRIEDTNASYRANAAITDVNGNTTYPSNTNKSDYINLFPSVQFKYTVNPQLQLRAAYSTGIARPGFQQISAAESVDFTASPIAVTKGNPDLKPTTQNAFDLTAEYYTNHDGLLSINPFYKIFDNYIVSNLNTNGTYEGQQAYITSYANIAGSFARGVELDAEQKFTFLPAPLDGFGIDANATFVDSRGRYDVGQKANELPSTSPITYNVQGFYEKGPVQFRVAGAYVSRNVFTVGGSRDTDVFSAPRFRLDVDAAYQATPKIQVFVQGKNLTNTRLEFTQSAAAQYPIQREFYDSDFLVGVRYSLGG